MKQIYLILTGISLILLSSCTQRTQKAKGYQTVKIDTIVSADKQTFLQFPGKVKAAQDISLAFRVSGTISKIHVKDGTRVQEGQLLAELDPTDYQVQLDATEAEYQQIKAEAERVMALYKDNGTTPNANDKAVYGLKQITAKYKHHKDQLAYTRLYAPFNGYVQKRLFEAHETIGAGMPVLSMISSGTPEVEINLPAAEYIRRDQFDNYHCTFDIYPGETYPLKLISVTPKAKCKPIIHHAPASSTRNAGCPLSRNEHHGHHLLPHRTDEHSLCPYRRHPAKRRQSVCIRLQPIGQHSAQTGNIHATFTEQRTQPHHCRTAETGRADCILGSTSHRGWRNCKTFTTCH